MKSFTQGAYCGCGKYTLPRGECAVAPTVHPAIAVLIIACLTQWGGDFSLAIAIWTSLGATACGVAMLAPVPSKHAAARVFASEIPRLYKLGFPSLLINFMFKSLQEARIRV